MAVPIIPRICRGRLYFQVPTFARAVAAWSAAKAHRFHTADPVDELIVQRAQVPAGMRRQGGVA
ncbi:hypothetical protein [Steroidobacter cummioxidans]|uniref:hypothetical protein n=1 Tax=Steroidobacter cummioxidans TaxID=1803913 RepID=UPI000E32047E|nr:hypothetical protein [Steroidobacter cummioxidans]